MCSNTNCKILWSSAASIKTEPIIKRPQKCSDCLTTDFLRACTALLHTHAGCISWGGFISTSGLILLPPSHPSLVHALPHLHRSVTAAADGHMDGLWEAHEMIEASSLGWGMEAQRRPHSSQKFSLNLYNQVTSVCLCRRSTSKTFLHFVLSYRPDDLQG